MPPPANLAGKEFGLWTVLREAGRYRGKILWLCRCDPKRGGCGAEHEVPSGNLLSGGSTQCRKCADRTADKGRREKKLKPARPCSFCGKLFRSFRSTARYCSGICRARARWEATQENPEAMAEHARRVTAEHKRKTHVRHAACANCGQPFVAAPKRRYCSRDCLDAVIRAGKYRDRFHERRVAIEAAEVAAELGRRVDD